MKWNWRKSRIIFPRGNEHLVIFHFNHYQDVIHVSFHCSLKMAPEEGQIVRNKLITITLAVIFMIIILFCLFVF